MALLGEPLIQVGESQGPSCARRIGKVVGLISLLLGLACVSTWALSNNEQQVEAVEPATSMAFEQPPMQNAASFPEAYAPSSPETEEVIIVEEPDDADALAYVLGLRGGAMKAMKAMKAPMKAMTVAATPAPMKSPMKSPMKKR